MTSLLRLKKGKTPDFKVSTIEYQVEAGTDWGRLGDTDDYFGKLMLNKNNGRRPTMDNSRVDKSEDFKSLDDPHYGN